MMWNGAVQASSSAEVDANVLLLAWTVAGNEEQPSNGIALVLELGGKATLVFLST